MPANPLTLSEREEIRVRIDRGEPITTIAKALYRAKSTISREISRNFGLESYRAHVADKRALEKRARPKKTVFESSAELAEHVTKCLRAKDSPN